VTHPRISRLAPFNTVLNCLLLIFGALFISACSPHYDYEWLEQKYANGASNFIDVDGLRVHYRDEHPTTERSTTEHLATEQATIVLIHGTASSLHTWDAWAEELKGEFRVIRMDLPGFGLTGPDHLARYEISDDIRFLHAFLNNLDTQSIHLAGSSLGGRIAWQYAIEHPERIKSLTLIDALGYPQDSWPPAIQLAQWPVFDAIMTRFSPRFMYKQGLSDVYHQPQQITETLVDRYFELSRYPGNLSAFPQRVKARLDQDAHLISKVSTPTLILWGEKDKYFPVKNAHRFAQDIPSSIVHTYPNVGHLPMEEAPQKSLSDFKAFLLSNE